MARGASDLPSVHAGDDSHRAFISPLAALRPKPPARKHLPHTCSACGARFGEASGLVKHLKTCRYRSSRPSVARVPARAAAKRKSRPAPRRRPKKVVRAVRKPAREAPRPVEAKRLEVAVHPARDGIVVSWSEISGATRTRVDVLDAQGLRVRRARVGSELGTARIGKLRQFAQPLTVVVLISGGGGVALASARTAIELRA